jgi:hypothetical protein
VNSGEPVRSRLASLTIFLLLAATSASAQEVADLGNSPAGDLIKRYESVGGHNIPNYRFDRRHTAGGLYQITDTDWLEIAPTVGVDLNTWPNAMSAPEIVQGQVAGKMWKLRGCMPWAPFNPNLAAAGLCKLPGAFPNLAAQTAAPPPMPTRKRHEWHDDEDEEVTTTTPQQEPTPP